MRTTLTKSCLLAAVAATSLLLAGGASAATGGAAPMPLGSKAAGSIPAAAGAAPGLGSRAAGSKPAAMGTQPMGGSQPAGGLGSRAAGSQPAAAGGGSKPAGALGSRAAGSQPAAMGTQAVGSRPALGSRAAGSQPAGMGLGSQGAKAAPIGSLAAGSRPAGAAGGTAQAHVGTGVAGGSVGAAGLGHSVIPRLAGPVPKVSSKEPGLLVLLTDGSGSMQEEFAAGITKADAVADVANGAFTEFVRANNQGGVVRDRWQISALRYGGNGVENALEGNLAGHDTVPLSHLANNPVDVVHVPDAEGQMVPSPMWLRPTASGGTPMNEGFTHATTVVEKFMGKPQGQHLVLGVHVSDGVFTDKDPTAQVQALAQKVQAGGGSLLMTNIHISKDGGGKSVVFPTPAEAAQLDEYGKLLFSLSSEVPADLAEQLGTRPGARMMAYNAGMDQLATVFRAGSSVAGGAGTAAVAK